MVAEVLDLEHASEVWSAIITLYSSQSKARINMLRDALANTKKNELSITQYITKMKGFASELSAAGKKVDEDEMKDYILNGLDGDYNPVVASINSVPSTTLNDMCSQLTSFDHRQRMLAESGNIVGSFTSSEHAASRGRGSFSRPNYGGRGRGGWQDYGRHNYDRQGYG